MVLDSLDVDNFDFTRKIARLTLTKNDSDF